MKENASAPEKKGQKRTAWLFLSLSLCFMVCVFTPLETYILNVTEFWYGLRELLPLLLVLFLAAFLLAWAVYALFSRTRIFTGLFTFGFFVFLGLYVQGNYIPRPYGILDGRQVDWAAREYAGLATASIVIAAAVLLFTVLSLLFLRKKIFVIASFVCGIILFSQISTIGILGYQNASFFKDKGYGNAITSEGAFELSESGKNIVVFLFDTFDGPTMTELTETDFGREICAELTGFTFYPDTVGCYTLTEGAVPYILEGAWYTNDIPYAEHVQNAYDEPPLMFRALNEADYSVGVYTYANKYLSQDADMYINVFKARYKVNDNVRFLKNIVKMSLFNYMPHQLKYRFIIYSGDLNELRQLTGKEVYPSTIPELYALYQERGLQFTDTQNSFRFYYTDGVHQSYTFDENIRPGSHLTYFDEAKGCLHFLSDYVAELKAQGKYDDTAIIVMADHSDGWRELRGCNPVFMVKTFGNNDEFTVSDAAISYEDLQESFASLALGEVLPGSIWSEEISERTERRFLYYQPGGTILQRGYLPRIRECVVKGFAGDPDSFEATGMIYEPQNAYYDPHYYACNLGEKLYFDTGENSVTKHIEYGISLPTANSAMTRDKRGQLCFDVGPDCGDLRFSIQFTDCFSNAPQRVILSVNGVLFGEIKSEEVVHISGDLIGEDGLLRIHFDYPDATTEQDQGGSDLTYLRAVRLYWLLLEKDT